MEFKQTEMKSVNSTQFKDFNILARPQGARGLLKTVSGAQYQSAMSFVKPSPTRKVAGGA